MTFSIHWGGIKAPSSPPPKYLRGRSPLYPLSLRPCGQARSSKGNLLQFERAICACTSDNKRHQFRRLRRRRRARSTWFRPSDSTPERRVRAAGGRARCPPPPARGGRSVGDSVIVHWITVVMQTRCIWMSFGQLLQCHFTRRNRKKTEFGPTLG